MVVAEYLSPYLLYPLGIFALGSLLIILLLYLIKPKIKTYKLPSLLFLMQNPSQKKRLRWFRYIPSNWILLLHLLIALLLATAIAAPYVLVNESQQKTNSIHIFDISASMQVDNKLVQAKAIAQNQFTSRNTIILVTSSPSVAMEDGSASAARSLINAISATDTQTALVSALQLAHSLNKEDAAIHVYSDFADTTSLASDLSKSIAQLEANDNVVQLHRVSGGDNNVGIVAADVSSTNISLLIRNFNEYAVELSVFDGQHSQPLNLGARDATTLSFPTPQAPSKIELQYNDDFASDNVFYFASLPNVTFPLLYVTNKENEFMTTALSLFDFIDVSTYQPPGANNARNYQAFVFENVDTTKLLPSTYKIAVEQVEQGGVLIVKMSDPMRVLDYGDSLPVNIIQDSKQTRIQMRDSSFTKDLTASSEETVFVADAKDDAEVLIETVDGEAVVVAQRRGKGLIVYYGIDDNFNKAAFKLSYSFPILLKRILENGLQYPSLQDLNKRAGTIQTGEGNIVFPDNRAKPLPVFMAETGFYRTGNTLLAVNLLNAEESDIFSDAPIIDIDNVEVQQLLREEQVPENLAWFFAVAALLLILFELLVLKWRQEL